MDIIEGRIRFQEYLDFDERAQEAINAANSRRPVLRSVSVGTDSLFWVNYYEVEGTTDGVKVLVDYLELSDEEFALLRKNLLNLPSI